MECNQSLAESFHADHIIAHTNGGQTIIKNGQALCAGCNLKKGSK
jgi:5-methylcytosine-specific restriction endonuclease McrA